MSFSGFVGGHHTRTVPQMRAKRPEFLIMHAVKGMLPKNRLADKMLTKLRVFAGPEHDHAAQNPEKIPLIRTAMSAETTISSDRRRKNAPPVSVFRPAPARSRSMIAIPRRYFTTMRSSATPSPAAHRERATRSM
jgi:hypothetical protein